MTSHIGGNPSFEMQDDKRLQINVDTLEKLQAANTTFDALELLVQMQGKIFNLGNELSDANVTNNIKTSINSIVEKASKELKTQDNRTLSQNTLDVAGPAADAGLKNCNGLANGWVYKQILTPANQGLVTDIHARQWGGNGPKWSSARQICLNLVYIFS